MSETKGAADCATQGHQWHDVSFGRQCSPCDGIDLTIHTCPKCGSKGAMFICDERGCPVNGGAAYE